MREMAPPMPLKAPPSEKLPPPLPPEPVDSMVSGILVDHAPWLIFWLRSASAPGVCRIALRAAPAVWFATALQKRLAICVVI